MIKLQEGDRIYVGDTTYLIKAEPAEKYRKYSKFTTWTVRVEDEKDGKQYFLKYADTHDRMAVDFLAREANFVMHHPYIEHIYDSFYTEDVMGNPIFGVLGEYIDGVTLRTFREKNKLLDESKMFRHMLQLLWAVQYYQEYVKGDAYVHRDLKPDNIMVATAGDRVIVIDFDWAHIPNSTATESYSSIGGTKGYADPRAFTNNETDLKMDIYALGRIFCFMLRGTDYFGEGEKKIYHLEGHEELAYGLAEQRLPEKYQEEEYFAFRKIIRKMVAEPSLRYNSIGTILKDMKEFLVLHYGGEKAYEEIFGDTHLLMVAEDRYKKNDVVFAYCWSNAGTRKQRDIQNYRMRDVIFEPGKITVMSLYCMDGKLYYVPIHKDLKKEYEDGTYEIKDGDTFLFRDATLDFVIYS